MRVNARNVIGGNVILNPDCIGMKDLVFVINKRFFVAGAPQNDSESQWIPNQTRNVIGGKCHPESRRSWDEGSCLCH